MYLLFGNKAVFVHSIEYKEETDANEVFGEIVVTQSSNLILNDKVTDYGYHELDALIIRKTYEEILAAIVAGKPYVRYEDLYKLATVKARLDYRKKKKKEGCG